jgi:hypothetical protein
MNKENLEWLLTQPIEKRYQLFQNCVDVAKLHYNELMEEELRLKTGEKYERGKPFMTCPILYPIGDQKFWGQLAFKKGLAVKPTPISKMTVKIFLERIHEPLTDNKLYNNAQLIKTLIENENGVQKTIDEIEKTTTHFSLA